MPKRLNIAVDFDNTYTADPLSFRSVMLTLRHAGHNVFIVTARDERFDKCDALLYLERAFPVYYCAGVAKKWWCEQFGPGKVDIWIDDKPENILNNSVATPEFLKEWRETREY